jgi:hypothetical protein
MKSEAKTAVKLQQLPGGSVGGWPLEVLRVETLELQAAIGTYDLSQIWRRAGDTRNLHAECLLAGWTTGKRVSALHTNLVIELKKSHNATTGKGQMQTAGESWESSLHR